MFDGRKPVFLATEFATTSAIFPLPYQLPVKYTAKFTHLETESCVPELTLASRLGLKLQGL